MRQQARTEFEAKYTAAANYAQLMAIYDQVIAAAKVPSKHFSRPLI